MGGFDNSNDRRVTARMPAPTEFSFDAITGYCGSIMQVHPLSSPVVTQTVHDKRSAHPHTHGVLSRGGNFSVKRLGLVVWFLVSVFAQGAALADEGVLCTGGSCKKITLKPVCRIAPVRRARIICPVSRENYDTVRDVSLFSSRMHLAPGAGSQRTRG
jgi:hypothetical protein